MNAFSKKKKSFYAVLKQQQEDEPETVGFGFRFSIQTEAQNRLKHWKKSNAKVKILCKTNLTETSCTSYQARIRLD